MTVDRFLRTARPALFIAVILGVLAMDFTLWAIEGSPTIFRESLVEANGLVFDVLLFGFVLYWVDQAKDRRRRIRRWQEELEDLREWQDREALFRNLGLIRRLSAAKAQVVARHAYLEGADLMEVDLSGADLRATQLPGANLMDAVLTDASLFRANLTDARLYRADLTRTDLEGAILDGADLDEATLDGANLAGASRRPDDLAIPGWVLRDGTLQRG